MTAPLECEAAYDALTLALVLESGDPNKDGDTCKRCGRPLTDIVSVHDKLGAACRRRWLDEGSDEATDPMDNGPDA